MENKQKIVVALGGNALGDNAVQQREAVAYAAAAIADIAAAGHTVVVGHGNGPQVGMIHAAMEYSAKEGQKTPPMPFPECGAMSQGYIGYHLQQAIQQALAARGLASPAVSVVTQVLVDRADPAFSNPTKPIGSFVGKEEAEAVSAATGYTYVEDAGRGYRRAVPSPRPLEIVELDVVKILVEAGAVVVTVGGGGIPVVRENGALCGVDAVIDKDRSSAKLAADLDFDALLILTAVDKVYVDFNKPTQRALDVMTSDEARAYIAEGHFAAGSMLPKVEAALDFIAGNPHRRAVITSLERAADALSTNCGTIITA